MSRAVIIILVMGLVLTCASAAGVGLYSSWSNMADSPSLNQAILQLSFPVPLPNVVVAKGLFSKTHLDSISLVTCTFNRRKSSYRVDEAKPSITTSYGTFTCLITFSYTDQNYYFFKTQGKGKVVLTTKRVVVKKTYSAQEQRPLISIDLPTLSANTVNVTLMNDNNYTTVEVTKALNLSTLSNALIILTSSLKGSLQNLVDQETSSYATEFDYTYDDGQKVQIDISAETISASKAGLVIEQVGSIDGAELLADLPEIDRDLAHHQQVFTKEFVTAFVDRALELRFLDQRLSSKSINVQGFDFVIADMFLIIPELQSQYYPGEPIEINCRINKGDVDLTLNSLDNIIKGQATFTCSVKIVKSCEKILDFELDTDFTVALSAAGDSGKLGVVVSGMMFTGDVRVLKRQIASSTQFVLNAIVNDAVIQHSGGTTWGHMFPIMRGGDSTTVKIFEDYIIVASD